MDYWYRHNYTGIIVNIHGSETMNWAGSDFDYDIIATTSDKTVLKGFIKMSCQWLTPSHFNQKGFD